MRTKQHNDKKQIHTHDDFYTHPLVFCFYVFLKGYDKTKIEREMYKKINMHLKNNNNKVDLIK